MSNIIYDLFSVYFKDLDESVFGVLADDAIATNKLLIELENQGLKGTDEYNLQADALASFIPQLRKIAVSIQND